MELTEMEKKIIEQYRAGADIEITRFADEFTYEEATDLVKEFGEIHSFTDVPHDFTDSHSVIVRNDYDSQVQMVTSFSEWN